jgi:YD repeat-containing protein
VGTEKVYLETVDGEERTVRWVKLSETEAMVERLNETTIYHYDEEGNLLGWEAEDANATYDPPLPKTPYPLRKGDRWSYRSNYTLMQDGKRYLGVYSGEEWVVDFERVEAEDGKRYLCAEVRFEVRCEIYVDGGTWTYTYEGSSWLSSEVGLVKEEGIERLYIDGELFKEKSRRMILRSVKMGEGE